MYQTNASAWTPEELEILQAFKEHLTKGQETNISPFSDDAIVRYHTLVEDYDVPDVHKGVRGCIAEIIEGLHQGRSSQVVILAGQAGMGKSHIINYFRLPEVTRQLDYVLVCNSNHWKVDEFHECLLDWLIAALTRQSAGRNLLAEKIEEIAFQALQCILATPNHINRFLSRRRRGLFSKIKKLFRGSEHVRFEAALQARQTDIFRRMDFPRFAGYVCDRFLAQTGNPFHRYLMHVLLRYLFEEDRDIVLHWLRRAEVQERFFHKLGVKENIDRHYKVMDAIQVLISLFTTEVAHSLGGSANGSSKGKVIFLAFDQIEGRHELFENENQWFTFFAQLSELYNTLPNVFILFTMPQKRRDDLHPKMERQFKERIRNDHRFVLRQIEDDEALAIFRQRVQCWLHNKPELWQRLTKQANVYLPFRQTDVIALARDGTIRQTLQKFDEEFRSRLEELAIGALLDYETTFKEIQVRGEQEGDSSFIRNHQKTLESLLAVLPEALATTYGAVLEEQKPVKTKDEVNALQLNFCHPNNPKNKIRLFVVVLPFHHNDKLQGCVDLLYGTVRSRTQLWAVRHKSFTIPTEIKAGRDDNIHERELPIAAEATLQAILRIWERGQQNLYSEADWQTGKEFLLKKLNDTYVGELLHSVQQALQKHETDNTPDTSVDVPAEAAATVVESASVETDNLSS